MSPLIYIIFCVIVPIQGGWSAWTVKTSCSSPCVDGRENRTRSCTNPTPEHGGEDCIGNSTDSIQCGQKSCGK